MLVNICYRLSQTTNSARLSIVFCSVYDKPIMRYIKFQNFYKDLNWDRYVLKFHHFVEM